ncbi:UDP-N-acetylglucosamine acyltransferase [Parelusimicrobium proximum]|uniref:acyl-ACP--UDP-N-acetylglucosamine O-acyltransferase n=1 Tax=Parelusimicrobium proximum TaxID=3228953 RepID=UPI003D1650F4
MPANIHPTAIVDKDAIIEDGAEIGPFVVIGKNVRIGSGTKVGPHCVIENSDIGKNNEFIASAFIGVKPQDLSYKDEDTRVVIGDFNKIRECVTIHRSTDVNVPTKVGSYCLLMANCHIAHDCQLGNGIIIANSTGIAGHVVIEDRVVISGMSGAHQFVRIGTMAMLSGLSGAPQDLPPYCMAVGTRAKLVGLNIVGLRRNKLSMESIKSIKAVYKKLFLSGLNMTDAIAKAKAEVSPMTPEAAHFIKFCEESKRGVLTARMKGKHVNTQETGAEEEDDE